MDRGSAQRRDPFAGETIMTSTRAICLLPLLMTVGCQFTQDLGGPASRAALQGQGGDGGGGGTSVGAGGAVYSPLPLENLEYPMGLWVRDGKVYIKDYEDAWQAERSLREYFKFYCYGRRHQSLNKRTPAEVYGARRAK